MEALTAIARIPKVKFIKGAKISFRSGRIKVLQRVRMAAAIIRSVRFPSKINPLTKWVATRIAKTLTIVNKIILNINFTLLFYNFKLLISNTSAG